MYDRQPEPPNRQRQMNDSQKTDVTLTKTLSSWTLDSDLQAILRAAQAHSNTMQDLILKTKTKVKEKKKEWTQFTNKYHQRPLTLNMPSHS